MLEKALIETSACHKYKGYETSSIEIRIGSPPTYKVLGGLGKKS